MAEEAMDGKAESRSKRYDNPRSRKVRGEDAAPKKTEAEPRREDKSHLDANGMLGRHAEEREGMRQSHEAERRNEHTRQRDEHRSMNARHETEHEGVSDHASAVAMNRKHEHEKHGLRSEHEKRHKDMADRHGHERHTQNMAHEAEMLGSAQAGGEMPEAEPPQAAAA